MQPRRVEQSLPHGLSFILPSFYHLVRFHTFTAAILVAGILPLASHAQTTPRFYVGVGANLLTNVPFLSEGDGPRVSGGATTRLYGPALTAGLQLNPHLALQAGVAYFWKNSSYYQVSSNSNQPTPIVSQSDFRVKYFTIPVLLRYTFTPAAERFHVDALAGMTLVHSSYRNSASSNFYTTPYAYEYNGSTTKANVTLGPAVRYTLVPNVELTANALVSATLGDTYYRFNDRLFLNVLVGAQYSFGH
jgi:hypothetical protein